VRAPFFGALPERGPWTGVALTRAQFLAVLTLSLALFVFVDGPVWLHVRDAHVGRIAVSYGIIPAAAAIALRRNRALTPARLVGATVVIALLKLLLTALLLVVLALAR
jgi:hypothetical protein